MPHVIAKSKVTGNYVPIDHPDALPKVVSGEFRKVSMRSVGTQLTESGVLETVHAAEDYVAVEDVDQYAAEARTRWQSVVVGSEHNSGPGGDDQHLFSDDHPVVVALGEVN